MYSQRIHEMTEHLYDIVIEPISDEDGGGYMATVPDLYGCMSDGETRQEALENVLDAITEWLEGNAELGREVPPPGHTMENGLKQNAQIVEHIQSQASAIEEQNEAIEELSGRVKELELLLTQGRSIAPFSLPDWQYRPKGRPRGTDIGSTPFTPFAPKERA